MFIFKLFKVAWIKSVQYWIGNHFLQIRHEDDLECIDSESKPCSSLPYPCISCYMNDSCIYGNQTIATCKANVDCTVCNIFKM